MEAVEELDGVVVRIQRDAAEQPQISAMSGFIRRLWRPGVVASLPMASAIVPLGLAKLAPAGVDGAARLVVAYLACLERLKLGLHACTKGLHDASSTAVACPLQFVDGLRDELFPADTILALGRRAAACEFRPHTRSEIREKRIWR